MYMTIFTNPKQQQLDFKWLLQNPFATNINLRNPVKKITVEITEDYGQKLFNKQHWIDLNLYKPITDIPQNEIKNHYRHTRIPKKSNPNKLRDLDIPDDMLKMIQTFYKHFIEDTLCTQPHNAAYAYVKGRGIVEANKKHQTNESKWFLQIDLKDFFPSINEEFLRRMLLEVYPFKYIPETHFENIIKYALLNNSIPQGSPLSPTLTNILMVPIDHMITQTLHNYNKKHYVYTRYADDIKISCKYHFNPNEIIQIIEDIFKSFHAPLKINHEKTRYGSIAGKNYYLGLILNKDNKISPGWKNNKKFRATLHNFIHNHENWTTHEIQVMLGNIAYYNNIEPEFIKKTIDKYNKKYNVDIMQLAKERIK